jgi:hypothetical protein
MTPVQVEVQELPARPEVQELIGAVAAAAVPVAVALGHATDDLVLNRVADVSFPTPTALGAWLRSVVEEKRDRARQVAEAEAVERADGLMEQLGRLEKVQAALARYRGRAGGRSRTASSCRLKSGPAGWRRPVGRAAGRRHDDRRSAALPDVMAHS